MTDSKRMDTVRLAQQIGSRFLTANAIAKRAIQLENNAPHSLAFEHIHPITKAFEELEKGAIRIEPPENEDAGS